MSIVLEDLCGIPAPKVDLRLAGARFEIIYLLEILDSTFVCSFTQTENKKQDLAARTRSVSVGVNAFGLQHGESIIRVSSVFVRPEVPVDQYGVMGAPCGYTVVSQELSDFPHHQIIVSARPRGVVTSQTSAWSLSFVEDKAHLTRLYRKVSEDHLQLRPT
jgi:hypothetical protein